MTTRQRTRRGKRAGQRRTAIPRRVLIAVVAAICATAAAVMVLAPGRSAHAMTAPAAARKMAAPAPQKSPGGPIVPHGNSTEFEVVPASDPARQAALIKTRCDPPVAGVTCAFAPATAPRPVLGQYKLLTDHPYYVCEPTGYEIVSRTDTTDMSDSVGVTVSAEFGKVIRQAVEASFGVTFSTSFSTKVEDRMHLGPYSVGFAYRAAPLLRATGDLVIREKGAAGLGDSGDATYDLTGVVFDAPDTSAGASGIVAFASRPMTSAEKASHCTARARRGAHPPRRAR